MIKIDKTAWDAMVAHVEATYPKEGCGVMIGAGPSEVSTAIPLANAYTGPQEDFFTIDPEDLRRVDEQASQRTGLDIIGIFHSHPDCDAYFSKRDLENSCPWYSFVVLSIKKGALRSRQQLPARFRPDRSAQGRTDLWLRF